MKSDYVISLSDQRANLEAVGGKGASLARLSNAGLPVPAGFHVTTAAYQEFVAENNLQAWILDTLRNVEFSQPAALEAASRAIQDRFAQGRMPDDIARAIARAYEELPGDHPVVAVRSSATAEDLPGLSFAGQQETFLNIQGVESVQAGVQRCWASLWTARAIGYRAQHGIDQGAVRLAVVVQILVHAEASGILFTANPVTGQRDQAVISASWGLGEAVVGGLVTPDTFTVDKTSGQVLSREIADKQVMTVLLESNTAEHAVPETMRRVPSLSDLQVRELVKLGVEIEGLYQVPMDIEWALAEGKFAIVQARPITALPSQPPTLAEESVPPPGWPMPNPKAMYGRGSLCEHLPNPACPLFGTLGLRQANRATDELMGGLTATRLEYRYLTINGYVYFETLMGPREIWAYIKMTVQLMGMILRTGMERWQAGRVRLMEAAARWEARQLQDLSPSELLAGARELCLESMHFYTVIQAGTLPSSTTAETVFRQVYKLVKGKEGPDATAFLFGFDTEPLRAEKALYDLAAWVKERPALMAYLLSTPSDKLADDLATSLRPGDDRAEWRDRFRAHVERHGKTIYEFDFVNPTPIEAPGPLLDALKMYLEGKGADPYERERTTVARREQATQEVLGRVGWPRKNLFLKALRWAQKHGPAREDSLADLGLAHPAIRSLLGELGRRLAAGEAIDTAGDIYWLEEGEVEELATGLERGGVLPDHRGRIASRKAAWQVQQRLVPPAMLPEKSRWSMLLPWSKQQQDRNVLKGVGTSAGQVTATARVLFGPEDFGQMRPGDVLVAITTTPAWTPLFTMASAVVTDIGGPLSHSSIVAREFGIPAVMATGVATRRITSGQTITVDGSAGLVLIGNGRN